MKFVHIVKLHRIFCLSMINSQKSVMHLSLNPPELTKVNMTKRVTIFTLTFLAFLFLVYGTGTTYSEIQKF